MRFDFTGDLLRKMEEYELAALTVENVSGETVSSVMTVGMVWNRR